MSTVLTGLFLIILGLCVLLNFLTLPGNWVIGVLVVLWAVFVPENPLGWQFFLIFGGILISGEVIEFLLQIRGAQKSGCSRSSNILGIIGAIAGGIFCAPFFLGFGAILGALGGAWLGSFIGERLIERKPQSQAIAAANGALAGKFLGMIVKFGLGVSMIAYTAYTLFNAAEVLPVIQSGPQTVVMLAATLPV